MLKTSRIQAWGWSFLRLVLVAGIGFIIVYPLLKQVSMAVKHPNDMYDLTVNWIPRQLTLLNFEAAYKLLNYSKAFLGTFFMASSLSLLELTACLIVGYGFGRFKFKGSKLLFALVLLTIVIPPQMIMVPLFLNFRYFTLFGLFQEPGLNLLGTSWPLALLAATGTAKRSGLFIYISRQFFRNMSPGLEEAAYIDGAGALRTMFQVMLPNAVPIGVIIFLFSFVWNWNDLFYTELFLRGKTLLPLALESLHSRFAAYGERMTVEGTYIQLVNNAAMLLYITPLLTLYAFLQRFFVESIEKSGIVG